MITYDTPAGRPVAQADNLAIIAFILAFFLPLVGLIMGVVSRKQAKRAGMKPNALSTWAAWLGGIFTAITAIIVITVLAGLGAAVNQSVTSVTPPPVTAPVYASPVQTQQAPAGTFSEQNALRSARDYLSMQAFSRKGLIQQLSSPAADGFSRADAVWAVRHLHVSWFAEAVKAGREYLQIQSFSRSGLIEQLSSPAADQFTVAQATYAVNKLGL